MLHRHTSSSIERHGTGVPVLEARGIAKRFRKAQVLEHVDLDVHAGEVVALTGENGAGKSTMLRICAGLLRADAGSIRVGGRIGYCPQRAGLFEQLGATDHLAMFARASGMNRDEGIRRGRAILAEFDFPTHASTVVAELSGGTRQKLNLAIALLADPGVLLLDEPYQGFDHGTYVNFWDHCDRWRREGKAVVVVTHMLAELARVDRVVELRPHESAGGAR